jgi:hypothetical protein
VIDEKVEREVTAITVPPVVKWARAFLGTGIAVWSIGVIGAVAGVWRYSTAIEPAPSLAPIVALLVWRATLLSVAIVAYRGLRRRRASARWLTIGLATVASYLMIPSLNHSWRAINGDYRTPEALIAYASAQEGGIALVVQVAMIGSLVVLVRQLAVGRNAARFFSDSDQTERHNAA